MARIFLRSPQYYIFINFFNLEFSVCAVLGNQETLLVENHKVIFNQNSIVGIYIFLNVVRGGFISELGKMYDNFGLKTKNILSLGAKLVFLKKGFFLYKVFHVILYR